MLDVVHIAYNGAVHDLRASGDRRESARDEASCQALGAPDGRTLLARAFDDATCDFLVRFALYVPLSLESSFLACGEPEEMARLCEVIHH